MIYWYLVLDVVSACCSFNSCVAIAIQAPRGGLVSVCVLLLVSPRGSAHVEQEHGQPYERHEHSDAHRRRGHEPAIHERAERAELCVEPQLRMVAVELARREQNTYRRERRRAAGVEARRQLDALLLSLFHPAEQERQRKHPRLHPSDRIKD